MDFLRWWFGKQCVCWDKQRGFTQPVRWRDAFSCKAQNRHSEEPEKLISMGLTGSWRRNKGSIKAVSCPVLNFRRWKVISRKDKYNLVLIHALWPGLWVKCFSLSETYGVYFWSWTDNENWLSTWVSYTHSPGTPHVSPARTSLVLGRDTPKPCAGYIKAHPTTKQSFTNFPAVEIKKPHTVF